MLTVSGLTRLFTNRFDSNVGGVRDAAFELPAGTFFTLLGPSGCGKTTTLRCIAGLERPDAGRISLDGRPIFDGDRGVLVPVHERGIGMVFQSYAIWPHMTVFENVAFPLRVARRRMARETLTAKVERALVTVGLGGYGPRPATRLSGGQQQRVALARAIVHEPKLLLLDEPLSNLDATLREEMRGELRRLQKEIGITTVYVTHDQSEALAMSDRIAVMDAGRIVQLDTPRAIYSTPATEFVARFIGGANIFAGTAETGGQQGARGVVRLAGGDRIVAHFPCTIAAGAAVHVAVRPENIAVTTVVPADAAAGNALLAVVSEVSFLGAGVRCDVRAGDLAIRASIAEATAPQVGSTVMLRFTPDQTIALPG